MIARTVVVVVLAVTPALVHSQTIRGTVVENGSNIPIAFATVELVANKNGSDGTD